MTRYRRISVAVAVAASAALVGFGIVLSIAIRIEPAFDIGLIWTLAGKTHLGPVALLHALALAYLFAVLVPKVVLKKRLDVERLVAGRIPRLSSAIEKQIRTVS